MRDDLSLDDLSRLLDGQCSPVEQADLEDAFQRSSSGRALLNLYKKLSADLTSGFAAESARRQAEAETEASDLDDDTLLDLANGTLSDEAHRQLEQRLETNPALFRELLGHMRASLCMAMGEWPAVPKEVTERDDLRGLGAPPPPPEEGESVTISISLGESEREEAVVSYGKARLFLALTALPGRDAAGLELRLLRSGRPWPGVEVVLAEAAAHKKLATRDTLPDGTQHFRRLGDGEYDVFLPEALVQAHITIIL